MYTIKPLVWEQSPHGDWTAHTIFGSFYVRCDYGTWAWEYCIDEYYDEGRYETESAETGKRAAEEFYLSRLLPALDQNPPPAANAAADEDSSVSGR